MIRFFTEIDISYYYNHEPYRLLKFNYKEYSGICYELMYHIHREDWLINTREITKNKQKG